MDIRDQLSQFRGPFTPLGLAVAVTACVLDQASKLWLLYDFDLAGRGRVALAPVVELVLVRNYGISYGWFQGLGVSARWALLAVTGIAVIFLLTWLARAGSKLSGLALGLIIGGAIGNVIDRLRFGAVIDFLDFHLASWHWPAFNLADSAICLGVAAMLFDGMLSRRPAPQAKGREDLSP
jgi:signal peptidase II